MPFHAEAIAGVVTGAVTGLAGLISDTISSTGAAPIVAVGGPGFPGAAPVPTTTVGAPGGFGLPGEAGVGAVPAISTVVGAVVRRVVGPAAVIGGVGTIVGDIVGGGNGARPMTRRQAILAQARANSPGATAKKIVRSARECGIELAAATFGLNVLDVCFLIAQPPTRRSRGISAADMRRTRSTIRKVTTIQKQLKALGGPRRR